MVREKHFLVLETALCWPLKSSENSSSSSTKDLTRRNLIVGSNKKVKQSTELRLRADHWTLKQVRDSKIPLNEPTYYAQPHFQNADNISIGTKLCILRSKTDNVIKIRERDTTS